MADDFNEPIDDFNEYTKKYMITSLDQLDSNQTYTYSDYLGWKFEEYVELIKGKVLRMA